MKIARLKVAPVLSALLILGLSTPAFANDGMFYFCSATSSHKKSYYYTELFEGSLKISVSQDFRTDLEEKFGQIFESAKCIAYGSKAKPVKLQFAEKLRKLEIKNNSIIAQGTLLEWTPQ